MSNGQRHREDEVLGQLVREHRRRLGLTQDDLAAESGVGVRAIRSIESGRIRSPRPATLRQLAEALRLTGADRDAFYVAPGESRPAAFPVVPAEHPARLPRDMADFAGREILLARLNNLVDARPSAVVISAIARTTGVGMTGLAVHWARLARDRFPDGQMYVNLRGSGPSGPVMDPEEALRLFLDGLGVAPERIPRGLDSLVGLYRTMLAGRRVLVVLDNAQDAAQVRPLLPGATGCLAVVTSRNDLSGLVADGARPLMVDVQWPAATSGSSGHVR
jgi:transcriptional regulator with XRE-family HTH domain